MKNHALTNASASFLCVRQQVICLQPMSSSSIMGYVWRRIFLKGGRPKVR